MEGNYTSVPRFSREWEKIHSGFLVIVIVAALIGNGFVCTAVYRINRLQKVSYYYLVSLAASDILFVLFALPFRIYFDINTQWLLGEETCQFWIFVDLLCTSASIVNLALISVDRYIALSRPLRYIMIMTTRRCKISIIAVWLFCFMISILSVHTWSEDGGFADFPTCLKRDKIYYTITTILAILIPLIILLVLYFLVFKMALEQGKRIYRGTYDSSIRHQEACSNNRAPSLRRNGQYSNGRRMAIRELKATKTLIIVVGTFLLCWLPLFVILLLQQHSPGYIEAMTDKTQEIIGQLFLYTLPPLNSAVNPFIYTFFNSEFRKVFKDTFGKTITFLTSKLRESTQRQRDHPSQE